MSARLDITQDTQSLAIFQDNADKLIEQLETTDRTITLTVDGQPKAVLQNPAAYQRLLDLAALADPEEGIRQGLEDVTEGRMRPAREVFAELREEYGIRGQIDSAGHHRSTSHLCNHRSWDLLGGG